VRTHARSLVLATAVFTVLVLVGEPFLDGFVDGLAGAPRRP